MYMYRVCLLLYIEPWNLSTQAISLTTTTEAKGNALPNVYYCTVLLYQPVLLYCIAVSTCTTVLYCCINLYYCTVLLNYTVLYCFTNLYSHYPDSVLVLRHMYLLFASLGSIFGIQKFAYLVKGFSVLVTASQGECVCCVFITAS